MSTTLDTIVLHNTKTPNNYANELDLILSYEQSTENNQTTLYWSIYKTRYEGTSGTYTSTTYTTLTIDGNTILSSYRNSGTVVPFTLTSGSLVLDHADNGTRSFTVTFTTRWSTTNRVATLTTTNTYTLPQINRASVITSLSPTEAYIGDTVTISKTTYYAGFTEALTYAVGSSTGSISSTSWTIPSSLYAEMSSSNITGTITLTTSSDGTTIGTSSKSLTIKAKTPSVSFTDIYRCTSDGTVAEDGTYVYVSIYYLLRSGYNQSSTLAVEVDGTTTNISISSASGTVTAILGGALSTNSQYTITATLTDANIYSYNNTLAVSSASSQLSSMTLPISLYDDGTDVGVSIGRVATEGGFFRCVLPANFSRTIGCESVISGVGVEVGYGLSMGGYMDFHYNDPTLSNDFSSRLQGTSEGAIYVNSIYDSFLGMGRYSRASGTSLSVTCESDHHALVMVDSTDLWLVHNNSGTLDTAHIYGSTSATFTHVSATSTTSETMTITLTSSALISALVL